jgi:GNAT superfamily N-acetyltransferase
MSVSIRRATLDDEAIFLELIDGLFEPPGSRPARYTVDLAREGLRYCVERDNADVLLAFEGDTAVGLSSVYADFPSIRFGLRCRLQDLVVVSSRRSTGVGRALLEASFEWARARGCTHLELNSYNQRKDAHRFYIANGMSQVSLSFYYAL